MDGRARPGGGESGPPRRRCGEHRVHKSRASLSKPDRVPLLRPPPLRSRVQTGLEALGTAKGVPIYRIASHRCTVPEVPRSWVGGSSQRDQRRLLPTVEPHLAVLPPF